MPKKKKTVKISDINKEIAEEMVEERKAKEIADGIKSEIFKGDIIRSVNDLDESVNSLLNITSMLDKRIDMLKENYKDLVNKVNKVCKRLGI